MDKNDLISLLNKHYQDFIEYIKSLSEEDYQFRYKEKWDASQQLSHLILSVKPLVQVFSLPPSLIEEKFGKTDRAGVSYEALREDYLEKLKEGGKAPARYLPEVSPFSQREALCRELTQAVMELSVKIENFPEKTLDQLQIPHPLLANLTMREMLFNATYHPIHHLELTRQYLAFR